MKKLKTLTVVFAAIFATAGAGMAGKTACCSLSEAKGEAKAEGDCGAVMAKMDLTDEQKAELATLKKDCKEGGCSEESRAKFLEGAKGILSEEQLAEVKAACEAAATAKPKA